jgi:amino acid adenylation domain-containing protein
MSASTSNSANLALSLPATRLESDQPMSDDTSSRNGLSGAQRASLAARLRGSRTADTNAVRRRPAGLTQLPLSYGQEQLWFIEQFAKDATTYNLAFSMDLAGELDLAALNRSLDRLLARHEALRTRLINEAGIPQQVIDPPRPLALAPITLTGADLATREQQLAVIEQQETETPFDLAAGPLFRVRLVQTDPQRHTLVFGVHHSVFDGWSFEVLIAEFASCYQAEAAGDEPRLPQLPVQLADYALWERERLTGPALDKLVDFWQQALSGLATLQLPTDRPRPLLQSVAGGLRRRELPAELLSGLRALAQRAGVTPFVLMLAAVQVLLHRYAGQDDIAVSTASTNRTRPELSSMIGYLVNALVARGDLSGNPTFLEFLQRLQEYMVAGYAHQALPFARLVEVLKVPRDASRPALAQVGFTLADMPATVSAGGVEIAVRQLDVLAAKFDLNFTVRVAKDALLLDLSYASELFDAETADQLLSGLEALLRGVLADPDQPVSRLPVMPEAEWRREVHDWNRTAEPYPVLCIDERFEQQVDEHPDAVAAEYEDEQWSYRRLNAEANRIARRLRELGIGPERLVGVSMQPSLRRLAGILGILKAGGGYVPLDPDLPDDRLVYMVTDAEMHVILTDDQSEAGVPSTDAVLFSLDREWDAISALDDSNLERLATPANVAYVIYTSGSTGRPKGVIVEHAQVVNFAIGMIEHWPLGVGDKVLQFASLNFDVSAMDMFLALLSGGAAVFGPRSTLLSPPRLAELMRRHQVSFSCLPPAVVSLLTGEQFPDLRVLISAGEALSSELLRSWLRPGLTFCNGYGPTEAAIGATLMVLDGSIVPPPIGKPMPNYRAYVLDTNLNPVPVGVLGELHLGGLCVTRGYLNQPELTRQRFIPDPFVGGSARMYKTGDLVRRMRDGNIAFVGRADGQVKIRGLRVELGEIEAVLAGDPAVAQAFVVVAEDQAGEKQLVGYLRAEAGGTISLAQLRADAAQRLPAYMVPAHLAVVDSFPLTSNGKIDVAALPPLTAIAGADNYAAPNTVLELVLVDMFATLLNQERVGVDDSFFDLGGNSLQAMKLVSQFHDELAVDADVSAIFLAPTPGRLAAKLREEHGVEDSELAEDELAQLTDTSSEAVS